MPEAETRLATTCIVQLPLSLNVRVTALTFKDMFIFIRFLLGLFPSSGISGLVLDFSHPLYNSISSWFSVSGTGASTILLSTCPSSFLLVDNVLPLRYIYTCGINSLLLDCVFYIMGVPYESDQTLS